MPGANDLHVLELRLLRLSPPSFGTRMVWHRPAETIRGCHTHRGTERIRAGEALFEKLHWTYQPHYFTPTDWP